ncbi:MAG: PIN domain-containing protein [Nanoarchaeota archaeon]|nr:PIN domain-containing protein [Nanoarchaeota archaeon]
MERVFCDTSFLVAYYNRRDENHAHAHRWIRSIQKSKTEFLISDYIFDEVLTVLLSRSSKELSIAVGKKILESRQITIIKINEEVFFKTWDIYQKYTDKEWSFTDCSSYVLMKGLGIQKGASFDPHFSQFGLEVLPGL